MWSAPSRHEGGSGGARGGWASGGGGGCEVRAQQEKERARRRPDEGSDQGCGLPGMWAALEAPPGPGLQAHQQTPCAPSPAAVATPSPVQPSQTAHLPQSSSSSRSWPGPSLRSRRRHSLQRQGVGAFRGLPLLWQGGGQLGTATRGGMEKGSKSSQRCTPAVAALRIQRAALANPPPALPPLHSQPWPPSTTSPGLSPLTFPADLSRQARGVDQTLVGQLVLLRPADCVLRGWGQSRV